MSSNDNFKNPPRYQLTFDDAVDVWLRSWAGQYQHHIAAAYGVNFGRVAEVLTDKRHPGSRQAAEAKRNGVA